jgi:hypothetical protein
MESQLEKLLVADKKIAEKPIALPDHPVVSSLKDFVKYKYGFDNVKDFYDRTKLQFDARRLNWEIIANITGGLPSRIYVPENLKEEEVKKFAEVLKSVQGSSLNSSIPPIGFYDRTSPTRFTEYELK